jgi:hypothetical protein
MALSNIAREPRREIIEQAFGTLLFGGVAWLVYWLSGWVFGPSWYDATSKLGYAAERAFTIFLMTFGAFLFSLLLIAVVFLAHYLGEGVCGLLTAAGFDPRPKQRY